MYKTLIGENTCEERGRSQRRWPCEGEREEGLNKKSLRLQHKFKKVRPGQWRVLEESRPSQGYIRILVALSYWLRAANGKCGIANAEFRVQQLGLLVNYAHWSRKSEWDIITCPPRQATYGWLRTKSESMSSWLADIRNSCIKPTIVFMVGKLLGCCPIHHSVPFMRAQENHLLWFRARQSHSSCATGMFSSRRQRDFLVDFFFVITIGKVRARFGVYL